MRVEIKAAQYHLVAVRNAPLPKPDQMRLVEEYIARLASTARPIVIVLRDGQIRVDWRDSVVGSTDDVLGLLASAAPDALLVALQRDIEQQPQRLDAMGKAERERRVAELEAKLSELEMLEEALIMRAAGEGLDILRRSDASPSVVLGVVIAKAKTTREVA